MTFGGLRFEKEDLMKKLLAVCAAAVLLLSLAACGKGKKAGSQADSKTVTVVTHDSFHVSEDLQKAFKIGRAHV